MSSVLGSHPTKASHLYDARRIKGSPLDHHMAKSSEFSLDESFDGMDFWIWSYGSGEGNTSITLLHDDSIW